MEAVSRSTVKPLQPAVISGMRQILMVTEKTFQEVNITTIQVQVDLLSVICNMARMMDISTASPGIMVEEWDLKEWLFKCHVSHKNFFCILEVVKVMANSRQCLNWFAFHSAKVSKFSGKESNEMESFGEKIRSFRTTFWAYPLWSNFQNNHRSFCASFTICLRPTVSQATRDRLKARESPACPWK